MDYSPRGREESDMTWQLNKNNNDPLFFNPRSSSHRRKGLFKTVSSYSCKVWALEPATTSLLWNLRRGRTSSTNQDSTGRPGCPREKAPCLPMESLCNPCALARVEGWQGKNPSLLGQRHSGGLEEGGGRNLVLVLVLRGPEPFTLAADLLGTGN